MSLCHLFNMLHITFVPNPQQMKTHVKEDCAMVRRTCRYQAVGCKFEVRRLTSLLCM